MSTVRKRRLARKLSLRDTAKRAGLSHVRLGEIERGVGGPATLAELSAIERVFERVPVADDGADRPGPALLDARFGGLTGERAAIGDAARPLPTDVECGVCRAPIGEPCRRRSTPHDEPHTTRGLAAEMAALEARAEAAEAARVETLERTELLAECPRDRGVDSAGNAALIEEVTCLRAQLARATEARDTLSAALRIATAGCDKAAALLAERTAERDEVTVELDRLTAIVAEYATRETEPPAEVEPEPPAKITALAVAIYAESHEVKGWDDCEAITHADHVEAIVRVRAGYASAKLVLDRLFYDVEAITAEQLEELAYNTLTSLVRAAREASPW